MSPLNVVLVIVAVWGWALVILSVWRKPTR